MNSLPTTYELVIIEPRSKNIVMCCNESRRLLQVEVDAHLRSAYAVTQEIRTTYGIETFVLSWIFNTTDHPCAILELLSLEALVLSHLKFCRLDEITHILTEQQRTRVIESLATHGSGGRFASIGWLNEFSRDYWKHPICDVEQVNCGCNFSLFRFSRNGTRYWFKAVGHPNVHEFGITRSLSRIAPEFVPRIVLSIEAWNAWVTEEADGHPLATETDEATWSNALADLWALQTVTSCNINSLRTAGAKELTLASMLADLPSLFEGAKKAMEAQTSLRSMPLTSSQLRSLEVDTRRALTQLVGLQIPDCLIHADLGSGNVIKTSTGTVFFDWAEAYTGNPFISSEMMLATAPISPEIKDRLRAQHVDRVCPNLTRAEKLLTASLIRVLGPIAAAMVAWRHGQRSGDPERCWPSIRSLLRHARRALEVSEEQDKSDGDAVVFCERTLDA